MFKGFLETDVVFGICNHFSILNIFLRKLAFFYKKFPSKNIQGVPQLNTFVIVVTT